MKKNVFMLVGTVALSLSLAACSESTIEKVETPAETPAAEETTEPAEEVAETQDLKIGDTVKVNDLQVTLNSVRQYTGTADTWDEAINDYYLIFDVVVENTGAESASLSSMMNFLLYDSESYAQDMAIIETKGTLDGEIGQGRKMAGEIAFDVTDSETFEFIFEDPFATGQAIWTITKEDLQ